MADCEPEQRSRVSGIDGELIYILTVIAEQRFEAAAHGTCGVLVFAGTAASACCTRGHLDQQAVR